MEPLLSLKISDNLQMLYLTWYKDILSSKSFASSPREVREQRLLSDI